MVFAGVRTMSSQGPARKSPPLLTIVLVRVKSREFLGIVGVTNLAKFYQKIDEFDVTSTI